MRGRQGIWQRAECGRVSLCRLILERAPEGGHNRVEAEGFNQVVVRAMLRRFDARLHIASAGCQQQDHLRILGSRNFEQRQTGHAGHSQIGDERIEFLLQQNLKRLLTARHSLALVPCVVEQLFQQQADSCLVVDDQNSGPALP